MKNKLFFRILLVVCCLAMVFSMAGCFNSEAEEEEKEGAQQAHEVIVTDITNGRIVVANLDLPDPFATENLIWEWVPTEDLGWEDLTQERLAKSLSGVKYRWSEYHQTNVVLFCTSRGAAGIVEYPSGKCLWKTKVTGISPHSIEMMPNGDIAVTTSGSGNWEEGRIHYYQLGTDGTYTMTYECALNGGHGLLWDPDNEVLWALGFPTLEAYSPVEGSDGKIVLHRVADWGDEVPDSTGHDLMPVYGDRDLLWITDNVSILQYSKSQGKLLKEFPNSKKLKVMPTVKGVTNFPDGVVTFVSYGDATGTEDPHIVRVFWPKEDGTYELAKVENANFGFNKIRVFTTDYV